MSESIKVILLTVCLSLVIGFLLGFLLGLFKKIFAVKTDPKVEEIRSVLPGANCGGCGYPGCDGFAAACAAGNAPCNGCSAGGSEVAKRIGEIMGQSVDAMPKVALLACQGTKDCAMDRGFYNGIKSCKSAVLAINGTKMCTFGCVGFGDCLNVCKFDALTMGDDGLPHVDYKKCVGCGACAKACPKGLFVLLQKNTKGSVALCSNRSENRPLIKKNCSKGCIKCGLCVKKCPKGAIALVNGLPVIDYSKCDSCGTCVTVCSSKVFTLFENLVAEK